MFLWENIFFVICKCSFAIIWCKWKTIITHCIFNRTYVLFNTSFVYWDGSNYRANLIRCIFCKINFAISKCATIHITLTNYRITLKNKSIDHHDIIYSILSLLSQKQGCVPYQINFRIVLIFSLNYYLVFVSWLTSSLHWINMKHYWTNIITILGSSLILIIR